MTSFEGSRSRDLIGKLLDNRYLVESKLGEGGMAAVYLAADERLGRHVVVKVPLEIFLTVSGFRERFAQEIHALIRLDHPFIGKILDRGEVSGVPFAVLQYLAGGSLVNRIEEAGGRLTPEQIRGWLPRVAGALDFIHARNFLHRDIKPANILFDSERNVYIADFGIAKVLGDKEFTNLTQTGTLPGTVAYMAPEAGEHRPPGPPYDQYALAVVVYQSLSGDLPHEMSDSPISALVQKIITKPVPLAQVCPHLPSGICEAVMRALSPSPEDRFESCTAFAGAFAAGLATAPVGVVAPEEAAAESTPRTATPGTDETVVADETLITDETIVLSDPVAAADTMITDEPVVTEQPPTEVLIPERPPVIMPDESQRISMSTMAKPKWRLPTVRIPRISLPEVSLPSVSLEPEARKRLLIGAGIAAAVVIAAGLVIVWTTRGGGADRPAGSLDAPTSQPSITAADPLGVAPIGSAGTRGAGAAGSDGAPLQGTTTPAIGEEAEDLRDEPPAAEPPTQQPAVDPATPVTEPTGSGQPPVTPPAGAAEPPGAAAGEPAAAPAGETRTPRRISAVAPDYPEIPFALAIEGEVAIEATIDENGDVKTPTVTGGVHPLLDAAAIDAVQQWKYEPALVNGEPREYPLSATLVFALPPRPEPPPVQDPAVESARQLETMRFMTDIVAALERFREPNGAYPGALDELALMQTEPGLDGWGTSFWYMNLGDEYWLVSFGRDGEPGPAPPPGWQVGNAFEADIRLRAGAFDQRPASAAVDEPEPAPQTFGAGIETVPLTEDVVPPVLDVASVSFTLDRSIQDAIGLTARRVSVRCLVLPDGSVAEARVLQVAPDITLAAMARSFREAARRSAVGSWRFRPATRDGEPVAVWHLVHVRYQPNR
jgi:TonB family protein